MGRQHEQQNMYRILQKYEFGLCYELTRKPTNEAIKPKIVPQWPAILYAYVSTIIFFTVILY
jgi:hypothetical protein